LPLILRSPHPWSSVKIKIIFGGLLSDLEPQLKKQVEIILKNKSLKPLEIVITLIIVFYKYNRKAYFFD
jgi:hypothetical protein